MPRKEKEIKEYSEAELRRDWRGNPSLKDYIVRIMMALTALVAIIGMLYLSGVYQFFLYKKTSPSARPQQLNPNTQAETLSLGLTVVDVISPGKEPMSPAQMNNLVDKASQIWSQAGIELYLDDFFSLQIESSEIMDFIKRPGTLLNRLPEEERAGVVVFLVHSLYGVNGIAFMGGNVVAVAEYTTTYNFRILAHEVGHILGLDHIDKPGYLMSKSANSDLIMPEQSLRAREVLKNMLNIKNEE